MPSDLISETNQDASLEEKIRALEAQLAILRANQNAIDGRLPARRRWTAALFLCAVLVLSAIPPVLVVLDRWLKLDAVVNYPRSALCSLGVLCSLGHPGYFIWVMAAMLALVLVLAVFARHFHAEIEAVFEAPAPQAAAAGLGQRSAIRTGLLIAAVLGLAAEIGSCFVLQRIPGVEMLGVAMLFWAWVRSAERAFQFQPRAWLEQVRANLGAVGAGLFFQLTLILFMREWISFNGVRWIYFAMLGLAGLGLALNFKRYGKIYWISCLALVLFIFQMNSWMYSKVGDEYVAFYYVTDVIAHQTVGEMADSFFSLRAIYDEIPYLCSFFQYILMELFGYDHFGWHISNIFSVVLTFPIFYSFFKSFIGKRVAFFAIVMMATSYYLINFSRDGNPYLNSLLPTAVLLWLAGRAVRVRTLSAALLLGFCLGSGFYFYPTTLYAMPLPVLLMLLFDPPTSRAAWKRYGCVLGGFLLLLIPTLFQPYYWGNMLRGTVAANPDTLAALGSFAYKIGSNYIYAFFGYLFVPQESHFVTASHIDPLTAVFVLGGLALACLNLRRNRFMIFLVGGYAFELLMQCISRYDVPPNTRMFMLLPFLFVFAGLGLDWLARLGAEIGPRPARIQRYASAGILIAAGLLNYYQGTVVYPARIDAFGSEEVLLRIVQHDQAEINRDPKTYKDYLFITAQENSLWFYSMLQDVYKLPASKAQMPELILDRPEIPAVWLERMRSEENLVVVINSYSYSPEMRLGLESIMAQQGRIGCNVSDKPGKDVVYQLWLSPRYESLCAKARAMQ